MIKNIKNKLLEIKKITWIKPKELMINSLLVIVFTSVMTLLIFGEDLLISAISSIISHLF